MNISTVPCWPLVDLDDILDKTSIEVRKGAEVVFTFAISAPGRRDDYDSCF